MRKLTILGRGIVGCLAVSFFIKKTNWKIDWVYDPTQQPNPVGEGTTLLIPRLLNDTISFNWDDLNKLHGTPKTGILKKNWSNKGDFFHPFLLGDVGIHMNAIEMQSFLFDLYKNCDRVTLIEDNVSTYETLNTDFLMVCTGTPSTFNVDFQLRKHIPVKSCLVSQCPWDHARFNYSLTHATQHGWVFGIPLQNRCSIGYLFNDNLSSLKDVKADVENILQELSLVKSTQRLINFNNYSRIKNFNENTIYNGNASFFLEPLEATSTNLSCNILQLALAVWTNKIKDSDAEHYYQTEIDNIEAMICLHYLAGSIYKTPFWGYAKKLAYDKIEMKMKELQYRNFIYDSLFPVAESDLYAHISLGGFRKFSYNLNIELLGIKETIVQMLNMHRWQSGPMQESAKL
jgi:Tryptophan halogenase